jgi:nanoRNase/pAp phosphatase (c-di-AMP/oligoRNAs hydrolase)
MQALPGTSGEHTIQTTQDHLERLRAAIGDTDRLLILPHNDPDPDAIGAALALRYLVEELWHLKGHLVYRGIVGRAENRALMNELDRPPRPLLASDLWAGMPIALVDTQPGAGNNALPVDLPVTIVLDHHNWREDTSAATFVDVRPEVGATSTIMTEYLQAAGIEPVLQLATALFYGIKTDTMGLGRGASRADVAAYFYLQTRIDIDALVRIERAQVPRDYFTKLYETLRAAQVYDGVVVAYMGQIGRPDMAAEMADLLLRLEGTRWAVCMGVYDQELLLSLRTRSQRGGAGTLAQEIVGGRGTAGGHGVMAAGQVPLAGESPDKLAQQFTRRILQYLQVTDEPHRSLI